MFVRYLIVCLILLSSCLDVSTIFALNLEGEKSPITESALEEVTLSCDLIVRGNVIEVMNEKIAYHEIFASPQTSYQPIVTKITIKIDEIIAGEYTEDLIQAIIPEGRLGDEVFKVADFDILNPQIGDDVIIGLFHNLYGCGRYFMASRTGFFKVIGNELIPYEKSYALSVYNPIKLMRESARKRKFEELYKKSDIICVGNLVRNDIPEKTIILNVVEVMKGNINQDSVIIDYSNSYAIDYNILGQTLLVFLNKADDFHYRNSAGINGIYLIRDDILIRDNRTALIIKLPEIKNKINKWKEIYK